MAQAVRQEVKVQIHSLDVRSRRVVEQRMSISPRSGDGQILHGSAGTTEALLSCNFSLTERKGVSIVIPCYSNGSGDRPPSVECSRVRLYNPSTYIAPSQMRRQGISGVQTW